MPGNQQRYKDLMSQGHSAAWDLEWEEAVGYYRQALDESPENPQAIAALAAALFEIGAYAEALNFYRQAAAQAPEDPLPLEKIAAIFEMQGQNAAGAEVALRAAELHLKNQDAAKAVENWSHTIVLDPSNFRARSRLALTYEKDGRIQQAVTQYLAVASLLQYQGNKDKAIEVTTHAIQLMPGNEEARQALGLLRANQSLPLPAHKPPRKDLLPGGKPAPAKLLEKPDDERAPSQDDPIVEAEKTAMSALARIMFEQADEAEENRSGKSVQSIAFGTGPLGRMQMERTQILLHLSQAVDLQTRGQYNQAAEELERALDAGLDHSAARFDIGLLKHRDGKVEKAMKNLQTSVKHPDFALGSRLLLGRIYAKLERPRESAIEYLEALRWADSLVVAPDKADGLRQLYEPLIEAYSRSTDTAAFRQFAATVDGLLIQSNWRDKVRQARLQLPIQDEALPAMPLAEILTQVEGSQVLENLSYIYRLARQGNHRMAMEEAYIALDHAPTYLPLHTFMGEILMQQDRIPEAITKFNTVARAYSARGEASRSIDLFRRITRLAPLDLSARQRLIEQLTAAGEIEATIREYLELGDVYYRLAELDKARETYQRALNLAQQSDAGDEWTIEILHHLADIDLQRLDWKRALRIFEQIARIDPGDKKSALNLVELNFRLLQEREALAALGNYVAYLNRTRRYAESVEALEHILQNNPDQIAIKRTLAEQYQHAGETEKAIETWDAVASALDELGDTAGAIRAIQALLALNPPNAADYRAALAQLQNA
jgi:tetratricopeptide (TPR) repeat protein